MNADAMNRAAALDGAAPVPRPGGPAAVSITGLCAALWSQVDPAIVLTLGSRAFGIAAGFLGSIVTARYLQPAGRGEYFLALTTAQLIAQFASLGLPSSNMYFAARDRRLFPGLLANSVWIAFVAVPLATLVFLGVSRFGGGTHASSEWFALLLAPLLVFSLFGGSLFVGLNHLRSYSLTQAMLSAAVLPFMIVAAAVHAGPAGFLTAAVLGTTATILTMVVLLFRQSAGTLRFSPAVFVTTFTYSVRAYLVTLAGFVVLRMNVFILHQFAGAAEVGYYSVASQLSDTLTILPQSIALVLFPRLAASSAGRFQATVRTAARTAALLAVACAATWMLADPAVRFAFGPRFAPAVPVLRAMLPGVFFVGIVAVLSQYLAATGFPVAVIAVWTATVALNVWLGHSLMAGYGATGAGAALSLTYGALLIALAALCWHCHRRSASA
jgi:enterobacterial common antigen flippase